MPAAEPHVYRKTKADAAWPGDLVSGKRYWRRRSDRVFLATEMSVRKLGGFSFQVPVLDVSAQGCRIELVEAVDVNDHVVARFPDLEPLSAKVSWVDGIMAGLHFQKSIHPAVFEQLLSRLAKAATR
jgi:hypothetical protein